MERPEARARDQCCLIADPKLLDRVEVVGVDDPLHAISRVKNKKKFTSEENLRDFQGELERLARISLPASRSSWRDICQAGIGYQILARPVVRAGL